MKKKNRKFEMKGRFALYLLLGNALCEIENSNLNGSLVN